MAGGKKTTASTESKDVFQEKIMDLEKKFGVGTIIHGKDVKDNWEVVSPGSMGLDVATGIGGWPVGCLIEVFGPESSGKTTMMLHAIAQFQQIDGEVVFINPEQAFDKTYATALGVNVDKLTISQPDTMEDMYNIAEELIKTGRVRLVIIDSHTAAVPKAVLEGEVGDVKIALQARINSTGLMKIKPLLEKNRCTVIGLSQLRTAIGDYGDPNKPTGGNAWKFYTDMRVKISKSVDKEKEMNKTTAEVIKNKCAPPFGKAVYNIVWGIGIDRLQEVVDMAAEFKLITLAGGWYTVPGHEAKMQITKVKELLRDNEEYRVELEQKCMQLINPDTVTAEK